MRMRILLAAAMAALAAGRATAAMAAERVAVLIVVDDGDDGDAAIGEALTEVAIARLAEAGDRELVGTREILDRMSRLLTGPELGACLLQPACLAEIGAAAGARRALVGIVHRQGATGSVHLRLIDVRTGTAVAQMSREITADLEHMIAAIQELTGDIEKPVKRPPPPATAAALAPAPLRAPPPAPATAPIRVPVVSPPAATATATGGPRSHVRDITYLAGGLAVVAFSAAAVTGNLATGAPSGANRAEAYSDLQRRQGYATTTNALLIGGAALLVLVGVTFVW